MSVSNGKEKIMDRLEIENKIDELIGIGVTYLSVTEFD